MTRSSAKRRRSDSNASITRSRHLPTAARVRVRLRQRRRRPASGSHAADDERCVHLPCCARAFDDPDHHHLRPFRCHRHRPGARGRSRRLPHQTLRHAGAQRPHPRGRPPIHHHRHRPVRLFPAPRRTSITKPSSVPAAWSPATASPRSSAPAPEWTPGIDCERSSNPMTPTSVPVGNSPPPRGG